MRVSDTNNNRGAHGDSSFMLGGLPSSSENPPALAVGSVKCIGRVGKTWCLMTTPRRRNKDFHFATAVCEVASKDLGIPFYKDAVTAVNRKRIEPVFIKNADPREDNIILYDDIITTGSTMLNTREMFVNEHSVFPIIAIRNR